MPVPDHCFAFKRHFRFTARYPIDSAHVHLAAIERRIVEVGNHVKNIFLIIHAGRVIRPLASDLDPLSLANRIKRQAFVITDNFLRGKEHDRPRLHL